MGTGTASCVLTPDRRVTVTLRLSALITDKRYIPDRRVQNRTVNVMVF